MARKRLGVRQANWHPGAPRRGPSATPTGTRSQRAPDIPFSDLALVRAQERKLVEAVGVLEQVRHRLLTASADARDSSKALRGEAGQARHHSCQLLDDAARLTALAERLVAEAQVIRGEHTAPAAVWPVET